LALQAIGRDTRLVAGLQGNAADSAGPNAALAALLFCVIAQTKARAR